ncbi:MAG TPA: bifunctional serine/threonine protein kinase/MFS transporter [Kofleriaceae bacterium]|nr:bifunctional serine/threonine protein kinase/MFS transporter [Kofleriaceae bacterium]
MAGDPERSDDEEQPVEQAEEQPDVVRNAPSSPRVTRLYGAVDLEEAYPATLLDGGSVANDPAGTRAMTAPSPVVGSYLERYRIGDVLGQGGMGEVLSARDEQIGRPVAIKRLRVENPSPEVLARFLREARIQGRLEHPAVVPVHELITEEGEQPFFVMKQLAGTTLADVIPKLALRDKRAMEDFTLQRLLRAFADVSLAIEFAHTRHVVHRDLKPANVVLGDFGEVYVLDWGIARITEDTSDDHRDSFSDIGTVAGTETVAGAILGTPGYIAPEQIRGDFFLDGRADVYSLGCILFEILALQPLHPRGQGGLASALAGIDARPSIRAPDRETPPELDAICVKATALDPNQRYQTARELGAAVQHFLDGNRDVALRRDLAKSELATARAALKLGNGPDQRRDALRAAARALALDPTNREPADLVGHLMLEPPVEMPEEVERELAGIDLEALKTSARFGTLAAMAYLAFFPILYLIGFHELWYMIAGPAVCLAIILIEILVAPRSPYLSGYLAIVGNLMMFALFGWMVSPIVIGPGPAIVMVTLMATHRRLVRPWQLALLTCIATLTPWLLEIAGVLESRVSVSGNTLQLHTAAGVLDPNATLAGLMIYIIALIHMAALLSRLQDDDRRKTRRAMQLQSWTLRQLVPRATSKPPP